VAGGFTEGKGSRKHLGALRTARISANAIVRRARSLFSPRKLRHLAVVLPRPLPFEGIEFEARQSCSTSPSESDTATSSGTCLWPREPHVTSAPSSGTLARTTVHFFTPTRIPYVRTPSLESVRFPGSGGYD
jgi:hypothetical protein